MKQQSLDAVTLPPIAAVRIALAELLRSGALATLFLVAIVLFALFCD